MKVLVIDVGGTDVKLLATGQTERRRFASGPKLTPRFMVAGVKQLTADWQYDVVSLGYPGIVVKGRIVKQPHNVAKILIPRNAWRDQATCDANANQCAGRLQENFIPYEAGASAEVRAAGPA